MEKEEKKDFIYADSDVKADISVDLVSSCDSEVKVLVNLEGNINV